MSLNTAYQLLPLPYGDWVFSLPFPWMVWLFIGASLLLMTATGIWIHVTRKSIVMRNLMFLCVPVMAGALFVLIGNVWLYWSLTWFYATLLVTAIIGIRDRTMLKYMVGAVCAALLYHQGVVIMVNVAART